jgi:hydroxyacylglutathione hydrolase
MKTPPRVQVGGIEVRVLETPFHTAGHVSYVATLAGAPPALFAGDAMFVGGCGRFFEGGGTDMAAAFAKFRKLPPETELFCGCGRCQSPG